MWPGRPSHYRERGDSTRFCSSRARKRRRERKSRGRGKRKKNQEMRKIQSKRGKSMKKERNNCFVSPRNDAYFVHCIKYSFVNRGSHLSFFYWAAKAIWLVLNGPIQDRLPSKCDSQTPLLILLQLKTSCIWGDGEFLVNEKTLNFPGMHIAHICQKNANNSVEVLCSTENAKGTALSKCQRHQVPHHNL